MALCVGRTPLGRSEWRIRTAISVPSTAEPAPSKLLAVATSVATTASAAALEMAPSAAIGCQRSSPTEAFPHCAQLCVEIIADGAPDAPIPGDGEVCEIHYGCLIRRTGGCVDSSRSKMFSAREPFVVKLGEGQVVTGMERGIRTLRLGALARLHVPSDLAYGDLSTGVVPPHTDLVFEVELLRVGARRVAPRRSSVLRQLLALPPAPDLAAAGAAATGGVDSTQTVRSPPDA
eukprot:712131-Prymnesium_polylepis.1